MKKLFMLLALALPVVFVSCNDDDEEEPQDIIMDHDYAAYVMVADGQLDYMNITAEITGTNGKVTTVDVATQGTLVDKLPNDMQSRLKSLEAYNEFIKNDGVETKIYKVYTERGTSANITLQCKYEANADNFANMNSQPFILWNGIGISDKDFISANYTCSTSGFNGNIYSSTKIPWDKFQDFCTRHSSEIYKTEFKYNVK